MWDYKAFPLWCGPEHDRAIPVDFRRALQAWSDEGTARFVAQFSGEDPPGGWIEDWAQRGRSLAEASTQIVGEVEYWNEATDDDELGRRPRTQLPIGPSRAGARWGNLFGWLRRVMTI
jgi:hypothetical protein